MPIFHSKVIGVIFGICLVSLIMLASCGKEDDQTDPPAPSLAGFSPKSALPGDTIVITGENFDTALPSTTKLTLGDDDINITSVDDTEIRFVVPDNTGTGILKVTTGGVTLDFNEPLTILNLYLLGEEIDGSAYRPKYWKNRTSFDLITEDNFEHAVAMDVADGIVYVAGDGRAPSFKMTAKYWVNGDGYDITDGSFTARAKGIKVVGDDIYVAGYEVNENGKFVGKLWKNGIVVFAADANPSSIFYDVEVFQNSVYVAGYDDGLRATYWKDGVPVHLSDGEIQARVDDIKITADGVFAVGYEGNAAMFWNNGIGTALQSVNANSESSRAASIFIDEDDIYICGYEAGPDNLATALLWENGVATALTSPEIRSSASSVFVMNGNVYCAGYLISMTASNPTAAYWRNGVSTTVTPAGVQSMLHSAVIAE